METLEIIPNSRLALWSRAHRPISNRIQIIRNFLETYKATRDQVAQQITADINKPITQSYADVDYDMWYIQWMCDHAEQALPDSEIVYQDETSIHTALHQPLWVCAVISPRNFPSSQRVRQVIPTLLAWNSVIYKPSSQCFPTAKLLSDMLISSLPNQYIYQVMYCSGSEFSKILDWDIDAVIFTGSTTTWLAIQSQVWPRLIKTILELWGSAPWIIFPDALIDDAMMQTIEYFRRRHCGQICDWLKRLIVHRSRYTELVDKLTSYFSDMIIWDPTNPKTIVWPQVSQTQADQVRQQIDSSDGEKISLWKFDWSAWAFTMPTLVLNPSLTSPVMTQEVFGPVLPIVQYDRIEEAVHIANSTPFWLGAYMRTQNKASIYLHSEFISAGNINVNNTNYVIPQVPFWGRKLSGNWVEHGISWLKELRKNKIISQPIDTILT